MVRFFDLLLFPHLTSIDAVAFAPLAPVPAGKKQASEPKALHTLALQKFVYFLCNLLTLALGLWKCRSMGLLPTGTGDWLAFETRGQVCSRQLLYCTSNLSMIQPLEFVLI